MKFSCVIGAYEPNLELLDKAINSALGLFNEIIVVDDGSKNQNYLLQVKDRLDDARVINDIIGHYQNFGFWSARNTGIEHAHGDIICTLDADDYFDRDGVVALKKFVEENSNEDIYHFVLQQFNESTDLYNGGADPSDLPNRNSIPSQSWFKKQVWQDVGGFKNVKAEDWNFFLRALKAGKNFKYFDRIVYNYNRHHDSVSNSWSVPFEQIKQEVLNNL